MLCYILWKHLPYHVLRLRINLFYSLQVNRVYVKILSHSRSDYRWGFGLDIGFTGHLYTQLGTTSNYSTIANLHTLQITTAHAMSFPACCVFISRSLVGAPNSEDSSASALKSSLHSLPYRTDLAAPVVFFITPRHGLRRQHHSQIHCSGNVFTEPFPSSGRLFLLIKNLLPSNRRRSVVCFAAVA
jgi:hypothetical protein